MIHQNIYFIEENKDFNALIQESLEFSAYLKQENLQEIRVFLSSSFDFCVALFGAMLARVELYILSSLQDSTINDENFKHLRIKTNGEFALDFDYSFYLYTSGSTAGAKAIIKTLRELFNEAQFLCAFIEKQKNLILTNKKLYTSVTHQHMFGLTFKIFLPLVAGMQVLSSKLEYLEVIVDFDFKDVLFISSPIVLRALSLHHNSCIDGTSLIITAGSKFDDTLRQAFKAEIMEIYGSTETGVVASNFGFGFVVFDSVDVELKDGRLFINSAWCKDFLSSDLGRLDGKNLTLLGRFDRIVKLNDIRFNLDLAEQHLQSHVLISEAKCALLKGEKRIRTLLVLSKEGKEVFRNSGKKGILDILKPYLYPKFKTNLRYFKILPEIPKNSFGKFNLKMFEEAFNTKKKPKFKCIESLSNGATFSAFMEEDCFFFEGHFRDFPLTPGFLELDFVFGILKECNVKIAETYTLENLKFISFLRPFDQCVVGYHIENNCIYFKILANEKICCTGRIRNV